MEKRAAELEAEVAWLDVAEATDGEEDTASSRSSSVAVSRVNAMIGTREISAAVPAQGDRGGGHCHLARTFAVKPRA
jgi:hypothetical protein